MVEKSLTITGSRRFQDIESVKPQKMSGWTFCRAWRMIKDSTNRLSAITRHFAGVHQYAATFINEVNDKLAGENIYHSPNLPEILSNRRSTSPSAVESLRHFKISCHNIILDTVVQSINKQFGDHKDLYEEISSAQLA